MNIVRPSGVKVAPVISQPTGPVRKRRISPVAGSQASIWLLPKRASSPWPMADDDMSVWIHSTPRPSNPQAVGAAEDIALDIALGLGAFVAPGRRPARSGSTEGWCRRSRRRPSSG
jgi:hypothetical protein